MITIYSLFWTIFNCSIMALIIFVLRTRTSFITKYGTPILYFLIICCIIRVLFPVEFPDFQYVIGDSTVYSKLCKPLTSLLFPTFPDWFLPLLIFVWVCGSIFHFIRLYISSKDVQRAIKDTSCEADGRVREKLKEIDPSCKLPVYTCSGITVPVLAGYFHPAIYIPDYSYSDMELHYILLHEYTHWKRKDIWKKFFVNIIWVVIWWNPAVYAVRKEVSNLIEFRCDRKLAITLSDVDIVDYLVALRSSFQRAHTPMIKTSLYTIEFVNTAKRHTISQRFDLLISIHENSRRRLFSQGILILLASLWMVASHYFILQPKYETPADAFHGDMPDNQTISFIADKNNAYLEEQADGSYIFYYNNIPIEVPSSEVESGLYDFYPIVKYKNEKSFSLNNLLSFLKNSFLKQE